MNIQHVIDLLNRAELYDEVGVVLEMAEQNKELLEALKPFANGNWTKELALVAKAAITKAEATE